MKIPLFGGSGEERAKDVSQQLTQNWYVHKTNRGKSNIVIYPTPGMTSFSACGVGPIRGAIEYDDELYVISANELYRINSGGIAALLGTIDTNMGRVTLAHNGPNNGTEILICTGTSGYIWDSVLATLVKIVDGDFPQTATHCVFMDGYFVVNDPTVTGRFIKSASYDGTTWDGTEIATAERDPDVLQSIVVSNRQLWLIGKNTAEQWFNSGAADFPFEPVQSGFSQWGTVAPYSPIEVNGMVFWLSENDEGCGLIVATTGGYPQVISTPEIATEIAEMNVINDCYTYAYQRFQHTFVVFQFETAGKTLVYDILEQEWHTWHSKDTEYHRSATHTFVFNKHLVGDPINGNICELDWDTYTDNGEQITRIRRSANIHAEDRALKHHGVWLDMKEATADATTTDPQVLLRWRDNNGSWSNYHSRSIGKVGEHNKKIVWRKLGRSRDRVYEIRMTDPVEAVLVDSFAKIESDPRQFG